jgi:hypothetical protein
MPTREELHKLIDSLPDGALEAAHRVLTHLQLWPLPLPPGVEEMRQRMDQRRVEWQQRQRPGTISGFTSGRYYDRDKGAGSSAFRSWDGDTFIVETDHRHKGHAFTVVERTRLEGNRLIYRHEVTGPGDKRDEREIVFDLQV